MDKLTEGEWHISRPKKSERHIIGRDTDGTDALVCACEIDADAKAIVTAVNNTYKKGINPEAVPEILEALKRAEEELKGIYDSGIEGSFGTRSVLDEMRKALKKAEL